MLAAFDIGNSQVSAGVFDGRQLRSSFRLASDVHRPAEEYAFLLRGLLEEQGIDRAAIDSVAISSVV
ncbi:MAG: type III pantothenate kinase, partial [Chloroflexi bacterium]|nr:type III pantothenate kinase [Chloroflexota bacterium]